MKTDIIKYCIDSFLGTTAKYEENIILFFEQTIDDDYEFNGLNLTELLKSYIENGDKTVFSQHYDFFDINKIKILNCNYDVLLEQIINSIEIKENRIV